MKDKVTTKMLRGEARKKHFEEGGTIQQWRGKSSKFSSRKKQSRGKNKKAAIDSWED